MRTPLSVLFARLADIRAALGDLLGQQTVPPEETLAQIHKCQAAVEACLAWQGTNDRERSVRFAIDNTLRSCLDGLHMAELGLYRNRRDMIAARAMARKLASGPPLAQRAVKRAMHKGFEMDWKTLGEYQQALGDVLWETDDHMEGVNSFVEKREPRFAGR